MSIHNKFKVVVRADASVEIGSGHIMRCMTLAEQLRLRGIQVEFACVPFSGNMISFIRKAGYACHELVNIKDLLPFDGDWLIVDHYQLDYKWEQAMRPRFPKIMAIDDLANRRHQCEILLDQNYYANMRERYNDLVPSSCCKLLGPQYALLRAEFIAERARISARQERVERIMVFFGGSDPTNETMKALQAIQILNLHDITIDVVIGSSNPRRELLQELCSKIPGVVLHCQINNMAALMAEADLAVGAGGTASWERCFLGLPTIGVVVADNQEKLVYDLAKFGAMVSLGRSESVTPQIMADAISQLITNSEMRRIIHERCQELMPGGDGTKTVIKALMGDRNV